MARLNIQNTQSAAVVAELDHVDHAFRFLEHVIVIVSCRVAEWTHQLHYLALSRGESASVVDLQALPDGGQFAYSVFPGSVVSHVLLVCCLHFSKCVSWFATFLLNHLLYLCLSVLLVSKVFADLVLKHERGAKYALFGVTLFLLQQLYLLQYFI